MVKYINHNLCKNRRSGVTATPLLAPRQDLHGCRSVACSDDEDHKFNQGSWTAIPRIGCEREGGKGMTCSRMRSFTGPQMLVFCRVRLPKARCGGKAAVSRSLTRANCIRLTRSITSLAFWPCSVNCFGTPSCSELGTMRHAVHQDSRHF